MYLVSPLNVSVQSFWSKYKVIISGLAVAVFTAIAPLVTGRSHEWDIKAIIVAICVAASAFFAKEARGKNWTIIGQLFAGAGVYASTYEGEFDVFRLIACLAVAALAIPLSPVKPSTYESAPTIVQAKEEAKEITAIRKADNATNIL